MSTPGSRWLEPRADTKSALGMRQAGPPRDWLRSDASCVAFPPCYSHQFGNIAFRSHFAAATPCVKVIASWSFVLSLCSPAMLLNVTQCY